MKMHRLPIPPKPPSSQYGYALFWVMYFAAAGMAAIWIHSMLGMHHGIYRQATNWFLGMAGGTVIACVGYAAVDRVLRVGGLSMGRFMRVAEEDHRRWKAEWHTSATAHHQGEVLDRSTREVASGKPLRRL